MSLGDERGAGSGGVGEDRKPDLGGPSPVAASGLAAQPPGVVEHA